LNMFVEMKILRTQSKGKDAWWYQKKES
jgi:hypothetical protein